MAHIQSGVTKIDPNSGNLLKRFILPIPMLLLLCVSAVVFLAASGQPSNQSQPVVQAVDSDADGLSDVEETRLGTDPRNRDTDNDGVSDMLELEGYWYNYITGKFERWILGMDQERYQTDPVRFSTDEDPYGDGMEVSEILMDMSVAAPGKHPLVPAFPDIYVSMIEYKVTPIEEIVTRTGRKANSSWANSTIDETTFRWEANGKFSLGVSEKGGYGGLEIGGGVSQTTKHAVTHSKSGLDETSWDDATTLDPSKAASLKLNLVFENRGTATAREVVPMVTALVGNSGIATYPLPEEKRIDVLAPGEVSTTWILGGEEKSRIEATLDELRDLQMGSPLILEINQMNAKVKKQDDKGGWTNTQLWSDYKPSIDGVSVKLVVDMGVDEPANFLVYARSTRSGPSVRVRDILRYALGHEFSETGDEFEVMGIPGSKIFFGIHPEEALHDVNRQLAAMPKQQILDVELDPGWKVLARKASEEPKITWARYNSHEHRVSARVDSFYQVKDVYLLAGSARYAMDDPHARGIYSGVLPEAYRFLGTEVVVVTNVLKREDKRAVGTEEGEPQWGSFHHDRRHTGLSPFEGPQDEVQKWVYKTGGPIRSAPAISGQGTILVGSDDGALHAVNPDGRVQWIYRTGAPVQTSAAIAPSSAAVYFTSTDGVLHAVDLDGKKRWSFKIGASKSSPVLGVDGTIFAGSIDGLYAVAPDGTEKWHYRTQGPVSTSSPAIGSNGTVYVFTVVDRQGYLHAVDPEGKAEWIKELGGSSPPEDPSPMIDDKDQIWLGGGGLWLYVLQPNGELISSRWIMQPINCPALGREDRVYLTDSNVLWAGVQTKDKRIQIQWKVSVKDPHSSAPRSGASPIVGADGTIYVGNSDGWLNAIAENGTLRWKYKTGGAIHSSPAIAADGTLYVGSEDGFLYAFGK